MTMRLLTSKTLSCLGLALLTSWAPAPAFARSANVSSLLSREFVQSNGNAATPYSFSHRRDRGYLVSFWAEWCVPCKEELRLLAERRDVLADVTVVAISVDDRSDVGRADAFLKSIRWPYAAIQDHDGAYFFTIQPSGELPLTVLFAAEGRLKTKTVIHNDESLTAALKTLATATPVAGEGVSWSQNILYAERHLSDQSSKARLFAHSLSLGYVRDEWEAVATHDALRQKRSSMHHWSEWEDEAGRSYIEWRASRDYIFTRRVRLGDDSLYWLSGEVLAARTNPETNEVASVRGVNADARFKGFTLTAIGGQVHDRIYDYLIDPLVDQSISMPLEKVRGTRLGFAGASESTNYKLDAYYVLYERAVGADLGYVAAHKDQRIGQEAQLRVGIFNVAVSHTQYRLLEEDNPDADMRTFTGRLAADFTLGKDWSLYVPLRWISVKGLPPRASVQEDIPEPFAPLDVAAKRSVSLAPRLDLLSATYSFTTRYVKEESLSDADHGIADKDAQQTTVLLEARSRWYALGAKLGQQKERGEVTVLERREDLLSLEGSLLPWLHASTRQRQTQESLLGGEEKENGKQTQVRLDTEWRPGSGGVLQKLTAGVTSTQQGGTYLISSGLGEQRLLATRLGAQVFEVASFSILSGREPGGVACTGGVCAVRPPLDGLLVTADLALTF